MSVNIVDPAALKPLGRTGIAVSAVSFGMWGLAEGWGASSAFEHPERVLDEAWDRGIRVFDTAAVYGRGKGETMLGDRPWRHQAIIATKLSARVKPVPPVGPARSYYGADFVAEQIDGSLTRIGRDHVDIYYLHNWFPHWHEEEAEIFGLLSELKAQGKVRAIGVALPYWYDRDIDSLLTGNLIDVVQLPLNLFQRWAVNRVIATAAAHGVGVAARSPLDHGALTTRVRRMEELSPDDDRHRVFAPARRVQLQEHADRICASVGIPQDRLAAFSIATTLRVPGVSTALVGMTTVEQVQANMACDAYDFSEEQFAKADGFEWRRDGW